GIELGLSEDTLVEQFLEALELRQLLLSRRCRCFRLCRGLLLRLFLLSLLRLGGARFGAGPARDVRGASDHHRSGQRPSPSQRWHLGSSPESGVTLDALRVCVASTLEIWIEVVSGFDDNHPRDQDRSAWGSTLTSSRPSASIRSRSP